MFEITRWDQIWFEDQKPGLVARTMKELDDLVRQLKAVGYVDNIPLRPGFPSTPNLDNKRLWVSSIGIWEGKRVNGAVSAEGYETVLLRDDELARKLPQLLEECMVGTEDVRKVVNDLKAITLLRTILELARGRQLVDRCPWVTITGTPYDGVILTSDGLVFANPRLDVHKVVSEPEEVTMYLAHMLCLGHPLAEIQTALHRIQA